MIHILDPTRRVTLCGKTEKDLEEAPGAEGGIILPIESAYDVRTLQVTCHECLYRLMAELREEGV
jgi:hypothetical protein